MKIEKEVMNKELEVACEITDADGICHRVPKFESTEFKKLRKYVNAMAQGKVCIVDTSYKSPLIVRSKTDESYSFARIFSAVERRAGEKRAKKVIENYNSYIDFLCSFYENHKVITIPELLKESKELLNIVEQQKNKYEKYTKFVCTRKKDIAKKFSEGLKKFYQKLKDIIEKEELKILDKDEKYRNFFCEIERFVGKSHMNKKEGWGENEETDLKTLTTAFYFSGKTENRFLILTQDSDFVDFLEAILFSFSEYSEATREIIEKADVTLAYESYFYERKKKKIKMILEIYNVKEVEGKATALTYNIRKTC